MVALRAHAVSIVTWILFVSAATSARSANLSLVTNSSASSPVVLTPLDAAHSLVIGVVNDTSVDAPSEFMTSWQFWTKAIPDAGTTGSLNPVTGVVPDNYVFADVPHFGPSVASLPEDPTTLNALDLLFPPNPPSVQIPTAPGKNLLSATFAPSADALGRFGIYAVGLHTLWIDSTESGGFRSFINVPIADGVLVRIGDVLVTSVADYNRNGVVDAADYVAWRDSVGQTGTSLAADGNGDGTVDSDDLAIWREHFGQSALGSATGLPVSTRVVPEPTATVLLAISAIGMMSRRSLT